MTLSEYLAQWEGPLARLVRSIGSVKSPDPWPKEIDDAVRAPEAVPLCIHCLHPQAEHQWFCPHCGCATGEFVPYMPYLQNFMVGELLRKGVLGPPEHRKGVMVFLVVFATAEYAVFAPWYWFWLIRKAQGHPICAETRKDLELEDLL